MKLQKNPKGYMQVCIGKGRKKKKTIRVHRAVAEAFIENPENKKQVNHIDGDKTNNMVSNLEWVSPKENVQHAYKTGLVDKRRFYGENNLMAKLSTEEVRLIREIYIPNHRSNGTRGLAKRFGVDHMTISKITRNVSWVSK